MKLLFCLVFSITIHHISSACDGGKHLPDYIKPCDYKDPNLEECIRKEIVGVLPQFAKGDPDCGIKSLDPFEMKDIIIDENNLKLSFFKPKMYGLSKVTLTEFKLDARQKEADFVMGFEGDISLDADYVIDGKILILPIQGKGAANIKAHNVTVTMSSKVKQVKDNENRRHMKLIEPSYKYDMESTVFKFENLFSGSKELSETTHKFANENWRQLMDELSPPAIKQMVTAIVKSINSFLIKAPLEEMLINSPPEE